MCPDRYYIQRQNRGFLIPLSALLVVGIGILAIAINRFTSQSSQASVVEGITVQAFYAAESGAYYGMNRLIFDVSDRTVADANCATLNGTVINFSTNGLQACQADISCSVSTSMGVATSFYMIRSAANCGSGNIFAERIVEVSSFL